MQVQVRAHVHVEVVACGERIAGADGGEVEDEYELRSSRKPRQRRYKIQEVVKMRQILLIQVFQSALQSC